MAKLIELQNSFFEAFESLPTESQIKESQADPDNPTPAEESQRQEIKKRRKELRILLDEVKIERYSHVKLQKLFYGNPDIAPNSNLLMHQGILKTFAEIREGKDIQFVPFRTHLEDYPISELEKHLQKGYTGVKADSIPTQGAIKNESHNYYNTVNLVDKGYFREHSMSHEGSHTKINFSFIEQRDPVENFAKKIDNEGNTSFYPKITIIANQPPVRTANLSLEEYNQAMVKYYMAAAIQTVAGLEPSSKIPVVIKGSDPEHVAHFWSAFIALGVEESAIVVRSAAFEPKNEKNLLGIFTSNSCYAKYYKDNETVKCFTEALHQANKNKKIDLQMVNNARTMMDYFKGNINSLEKPLEKPNETNTQDDSTPILGHGYSI